MISAVDVSSIAEKLKTCSTHKEVYSLVVQEISEALSLSRCIFVPTDSGSHAPVEWSNGLEGSEERDRLLVELVYYLQDICRSVSGLITIHDVNDSKLLRPLESHVKTLEVASILACPISSVEAPGASLILIQEEESRIWRDEEKNLLLSLRPFIIDAL